VRAAALLLLFAGLAAGSARAADLVVIESVVSVRPADADAQLRAVMEALGDRALHGKPLGDALELHMSQPGGEAIAPEEVAEIVGAVNLAHRAYAAGEFESAVSHLNATLRRLETAPAALVHDLALRRALHQARLLLGDIYRRLGRSAEGTALMADAIRADARSEPSDMTFNPDLIAFFRSVRRELHQQPRGSLEVVTRPPGLMVFLNDEFVGMSPTRVADLYRGRHQVVVQQDGRGRVHQVMVQGDERLTVDAGFDAALRTRPWVGLWFSTEAQRARHEGEYAARIGRELRAPRVVVVATGEYRERPAMIGTLLDVETVRPVRAAIVPHDPRPLQETVRALGRFLAGGDAGPGVIVAGSERPAERARPYRRWKWAAAATALLAAGAGAALLAADCSEKAARTGTCIARRGTKTPGYVLLSVGGVLGVGAGVLFYLDEREAQAALSVQF